MKGSNYFHPQTILSADQLSNQQHNNTTTQQQKARQKQALTSLASQCLTRCIKLLAISAAPRLSACSPAPSVRYTALKASSISALMEGSWCHTREKALCKNE